MLSVAVSLDPKGENAMQYLVFAVLASSCFFNSEAFGQPKPNPTLRQWSDLSGKFSITASVATWTDNEVNLSKSNGDSIPVRRSKLGKPDQAFLEAWISIQETKQDEAKVQTLIDNIATAPEASTESLIALHKEQSNLVAGLIASIALATSTDFKKLDEAKRYLDATLLRLRKVQKHLPDFHKQTLVSALNDSAVISLRQKRPDVAASLLIEAAEVQPEMHYSVYHNMSIMLSIASEDGARMDLSEAKRKQLKKFLPTVAPTLAGLQVPKRFLYCGQFDSETSKSPPQNVPTDQQAALRALMLWPELTCFFCSGTGRKPCPNCARGVVTIKKMEVLGFDSRGEPFVGPKNYNVPCEACKGAAGFRCPACQNGRLPFND